MGQQEVAVWLYDALGTGYPCSHPWSRHNYCPPPPEDRKRVLHPLPCLDFQSLESSCLQSHAGHPGLPGSHRWSLWLAWQVLTLGFAFFFSGILSFALHLFFELRGFCFSSQLWPSFDPGLYFSFVRFLSTIINVFTPFNCGKICKWKSLIPVLLKWSWLREVTVNIGLFLPKY